jgi:GGDEF domain-containing protein
MMPLPWRVTLSSWPPALSSGSTDEPFPPPFDVGRWVLWEVSAGGVDHALACQRIEDGLRRPRGEHQQLIVLFIDLGLQPVGDGDDLLGKVMPRLAAATRATDMVTRLSSGKIVLVAEGVSSGAPALVDVLQERCERVFARPVSRGGTPYTLHPRVGAAAAVAGAAVTAERLLAQAEAVVVADEASVWARPEPR